MIHTWENQYLQLLQKVLFYGEDRIDRTNIGTKSLFGERLDINLQEGFPAITTKKLAWKSMLSELKWFIEGSTDERRLAEILYGTRDSSKKTIWTDNANADYWKPKAKFEGDLGRVYGAQWRGWNTGKYENFINEYNGKTWQAEKTVDQLKLAIDKIKHDPTNRRIIVSAWNVGELEDMALPPCHMFYQFYVSNDKTLSMQVYLRSQDLFLGTPFNIASYATLLHLFSEITQCKPGRLIMDMGDCHIYHNHVEQVKEQLARKPFSPPVLQIKPSINLEFEMDDIKLVNYQHHETIKAAMAV